MIVKGKVLQKAFYILMIVLFSAIRVPSAACSEATPFDAYLQVVLSDSPELKAIELDIESLRFEIAARDLDLSATFGVELTRFWDDRPTLSSNYQTEAQGAEFILEKPLATGTNLSLTSAVESSEYRSTPNDEQNLMNWQLGITQSLWQNSFGRQTSLRRKRDQSELQSRLLALLLERQTKIVEFETLYWDLVYASREVHIRKENLERSQKIFSWIEDRFKRFAAERVDYLQGQALVASRELELQAAADDLKILLARLQEKLSAEYIFNPDDEAGLKGERDLLTLPVKLDFAPPEPVLIETLQSQAQAEFLKFRSKLEADQLNPVLEVGYSYGQQGLSTSYSTAREQAFSSDNDYHQVGVKFSLPLDFSLVKKSRRATEYAAKAQESRAAQLKRQSQISWADLQRTINEKKQKVQTAMSLAALHAEKSTEERGRFEKGKSTAFQAITFEQDAAESELLALELFAQLRRTEAQARIYTQRAGLQ